MLIPVISFLFLAAGAGEVFFWMVVVLFSGVFSRSWGRLNGLRGRGIEAAMQR